MPSTTSKATGLTVLLWRRPRAASSMDTAAEIINACTGVQPKRVAAVYAAQGARMSKRRPRTTLARGWVAEAVACGLKAMVAMVGLS